MSFGKILVIWESDMFCNQWKFLSLWGEIGVFGPKSHSECHEHLLLVLGMKGMEGTGRCSFQRHARMGRDLLHERK